MDIMTKEEVPCDLKPAKVLEAGTIGKVIEFMEWRGKPHLVVQFGAEAWILELERIVPLLSVDEFAKRFPLTGKWSGKSPPRRDTVLRWIHEYNLLAYQVALRPGRPGWRIPETELERFRPPKVGRKPIIIGDLKDEDDCVRGPCENCDVLTRMRCHGEDHNA
jgi:hypothetical protein